MRRLALIFLGVVSFTLRFYKLGVIPKGISMEEASFGLWIAKFLGDEILNPFFIRLPFAILGTSSIFLCYFLLRRLGADYKFSYLSTLILAVTPWHIQVSRIVSISILSTYILMILLLIFSNNLKSRAKLVITVFLTVSAIFFVLSIIRSLPLVADTVDMERQSADKIIPLNITKVFSNKLVASYRKNASIIFEHLDFGVYFFSGHPRQRWGVEETQKLFASFIPLLLFGIIKLKKTNRLLLGTLFIFLITLFTFFDNRGPSETLPMVFISVYLVGYGLAYLWEEKKLRVFSYIFLMLLFYEFFNFNSLYFIGLSESPFSPRRPIYGEIVSKVDDIRENGEKVLVNERLSNPKIFFQFYLKDRELNDFEFKNYNVWNEDDKNVLFVDVLPYEPLPTEPLYTKEGNFPDKLNLLYAVNNGQLRQTVFIYRYDKN